VRQVVVLIFFTVLVYGASTVKYVVSDKHAYMLKKGSGDILAEYLKLNDTLDVLNIKSKELGSSSNYGSIGDMDGFKIQSIYEFGKKSLFSIKYSNQNVKYGRGTLENKRLDTYYRYQLLQSDFAFFNATALDVGFVTNRANTMSYDDPKFLEPLAAKVLKVKKTKIIKNSDGTYTIGVLKNDGSSNFISNLSEKPTLYIKDMKDDSFYIRAITEKKVSDKLYISFFLQYTKTKIKTIVTANDELNQKAKDKNYNTTKLIDRDESKIDGGFNVSLDWLNLAWELTYTYSKLFRDSGLSYINSNHVINATLAKHIGENWMIYGGVKLMYRQFNGEIPYLYNTYTQSTFDHKYGYVRFGIGYRF